MKAAVWFGGGAQDGRGRAANQAIGDADPRTGTKVQTIRWYERDRIIPPPVRTAGGHRLHTQVHLNRVAFIRHAGELRFALEARLGLLRRADDLERSCDEV